MKKIFALLLAGMMLLGASTAMATALAEEVAVQNATTDFDVTVVVPDGYTMEEERIENTVVLSIMPDKEDGTVYLMTIAHSEEYDGKTLNELTDEEKAGLLDVMDEEFAQPVVHDLTTEHGTQVYLIDEGSPEAESYFANGFSLYQGYFVQVYVIRDGFRKLEQADLDLAMKILSDMWFVDKK